MAKNLDIKINIDSASVKQVKEEVVRLNKELSNTSKGTEDFSKGSKNIDVLTNSLNSGSNAAGDYAKNFSFAGVSFNSLSASLKSGIKIIQGLSLSFRGLAGAIAATGFGAIIIALGSLIAFFTQTKEGIELVEVAFGKLKAVVEPIIAAFGKLGKALFELDFGAALDSFDGVGKAISDNVKTTEDLILGYRELDDAERQLIVTQSQLQKEIDQLLEKEKNKTLSDKERIAILDQIDAKENEKIENEKKISVIRIGLLDKEIEKLNKLGKDSDEIVKKKNEELAKLNAFEGQSIKVTEKTQNKRDAIKQKEIDNLKELQTKRQEYLKVLSDLEDEFYLDERTKLIKTFNDKLVLIRGNGDREIALRESIEKQKALIIAQYDEQVYVDSRRIELENAQLQVLLDLGEQYLDDRLMSYDEYLEKIKALDVGYTKALINQGLLSTRDTLNARLKLNESLIETRRLLNQEFDGLQKNLDIQFRGLGSRIARTIESTELAKAQLKLEEETTVLLEEELELLKEGSEAWLEKVDTIKMFLNFQLESVKLINENSNKIKEEVQIALKQLDIENDKNATYEERIDLIDSEINRKKKVLEDERKELDILIEKNDTSVKGLTKIKVALETIKELNEEINALEKSRSDQQSDFTVKVNQQKDKISDFLNKYEAEIELVLLSINVIQDIIAAQFEFRLAKLAEEQRLMNERYDRELELINRNADAESLRVENSLLSEEAKQSELKRLEEARADDEKILQNRRTKENAKLDRQRNILAKKAAISQAIIGAALSIIQAFAQLGPIGGAIASVGIAITTGLQIATIKKQKFSRGGKVKGSGTGTSDSIPAMLSNGESVINARSTERFRPILSKINEAGGGVAFQRGGVAGDTPSSSSTEIIDLDLMAEKIRNAMTSSPIKTYVIASEVTSQQQINNQIRKRASF